MGVPWGDGWSGVKPYDYKSVTINRGDQGRDLFLSLLTRAYIEGH